MLGAYKKHPQAYLMYVEDCFLLSDNADASYISKGLLTLIFFNSITQMLKLNSRLFEHFD